MEVKDLTFELIQHRFTKTAKNMILKRYSKTKLNMDEEDRQLKWGSYGKFKYVYKAETVEEFQQLFEKGIREYFPFAKIAYFV
uniref:spore photoproduct lyase family protein n=1 Tax=Paenibacillus sp. FSL W7-1332 TaxID=2921702 RepID=UPI00403F94D9